MLVAAITVWFEPCWSLMVLIGKIDDIDNWQSTKPVGFCGCLCAYAKKQKSRKPNGHAAFKIAHGGRGGIRTRGGFNPTYAFQAYDLNRSSTLPIAFDCSSAETVFD